MTQITQRRLNRKGVVRSFIAAAILLSSPAAAQNFGSAGGSWSANWGFSSASDRSLRLQEAQAIRSAQQSAGPTTVVNTTNYNDSRANYQEIIGGAGGLGAIDFHIGDEIGQNTNSVGAMNTGSTEISVNGSDNYIDAINSADSQGCVDASILTETLSMLGSLEQGDGITVQTGHSPSDGCQ